MLLYSIPFKVKQEFNSTETNNTFGIYLKGQHSILFICFSLLKGEKIHEESILTLMYEVEKILNYCDFTNNFSGINYKFSEVSLESDFFPFPEKAICKLRSRTTIWPYYCQHSSGSLETSLQG